MAISGDYPHSINVNGFSCRNCPDVAKAEKQIDPANPSAGPHGVNDKSAKDGTHANHFSPEARNEDLLKEQHLKVSAAHAAGAAAAYGLAGINAATPGQFVNLSG